MLIGHQRIWDYLIKCAERDKLAHAYLFAGPAQIGKMTLAMELVKWLECGNHFIPALSLKRRGSEMRPCGECKSCLSIERGQNPDVSVLLAQQAAKDEIIKNKEIGIDEIRDLQHRLSLSSWNNGYKVAIIEEAAALSGEAVSALLKTLEEPSRRCLIILISANWQAVPPTIVSRCQVIKFSPVAEQVITAGLKSLAKNNSDLAMAVKLSAGRPGQAINFLRQPERLIRREKEIEIFEKLLKAPLAWRLEEAAKMAQNSIEAQEIMQQWIMWLRDRVLEMSGLKNLAIGEQKDTTPANQPLMLNLINACRAIQKTQLILQNPSFNARLALEVLMMKI